MEGLEEEGIIPRFAVIAVIMIESNAAPRCLSLVFFSSQMDRKTLKQRIARTYNGSEKIPVKIKSLKID